MHLGEASLAILCVRKQMVLGCSEMINSLFFVGYVSPTFLATSGSLSPTGARSQRCVFLAEMLHAVRLLFSAEAVTRPTQALRV